MRTTRPFLSGCLCLFLHLFSIQKAEANCIRRAASPAPAFPSDTIQVFLFHQLCTGESFNGQNWQRDTVVQFFQAGFPGDDTLKIIDIDVIPSPEIALSGDSILCSGDTGVLQVVGFFNTYNWSDGSDQNSIQVTAPGPYGVTVTASNGCTGQKSVAVSVFTPVFSAGVNHPSCADLDDGRIVVSLIGGGQSPYLLSLDGGVFQPDTVFDHLPAGDYTVILQDAAGCEDSASLQLTAPPPFLVDIGPDVFLLPGDTLRLSAAATDSVSIWNWAPPQIFDCAACPMPLVRQPATTTISLTASNAGGCTATDVLQLTYDPEYRLYVPNAFSPDGDGENDFLEVFPGMGNWEVAEFVVFDRWGSLIFRSDTPFRHPQTLQWDGMSRGKQLMPGVYSWAARLRLAGGSEEIREGDVAIIR